MNRLISLTGGAVIVVVVLIGLIGAGMAVAAIPWNQIFPPAAKARHFPPAPPCKHWTETQDWTGAIHGGCVVEP